MKTSVVIPIWNGRPYLAACLDALQSQTDADFELIVVDNASADGSADLVAEGYPSARLIRNARNLGFSGGCNVGMRAAQGEAFILLNQDTRVSPGWLAALVRAFDENPSAGIVGCKGLYPDDRRVQHAGGWIEWPLGFTHHYGYQEPDNGRWDTAREVDFVTGAAMGIRRAVIERIGLLDEGFWPGYFEDVDFCLRARAAGYRVWYCPQAVFLHHESPSTDSAVRSRAYQRGRLRLALKHLPPARFLAEFAPAELAAQRAAIQGRESRALRLAYLETISDIPALARQCWSADDAVVGDLIAALQRLYRQAWQVDWEVMGEMAPAVVPLSARPSSGDSGAEMPNAVPATAEDLYPQYAQLVQARRAGAPPSDAPWLDFKEYQFRSSSPVIGPLIARLRWLWFNVAARWAVLYLLQQQEAINRRHEEYRRAMGQRLLDLAEENMLLAANLAHTKDTAK